MNNIDSAVWDTFDQVREQLFQQFKDPPFDPSSGLAPDELEREFSAYLQANPNTPRVLQKAQLYRLVVTRGQIAVDPQDWFVDKLNHGGLIKTAERALAGRSRRPARCRRKATGSSRPGSSASGAGCSIPGTSRLAGKICSRAG